MQHKAVYYSASSPYKIRVSTTTNIRSTQNCNYSLRYCNYLPPTWSSWPLWKEVAVQKTWTVLEAVVTVLCTPDNGYVWHPKHVEWICRIINKLLLVASRWTIIDIDHRCTETCIWNVWLFNYALPFGLNVRIENVYIICSKIFLFLFSNTWKSFHIRLSIFRLLTFPCFSLMDPILLSKDSVPFLIVFAEHSWKHFTLTISNIPFQWKRTFSSSFRTGLYSLYNNSFLYHAYKLRGWSVNKELFM